MLKLKTRQEKTIWERSFIGLNIVIPWAAQESVS
jgi:hypothetical protein